MANNKKRATAIAAIVATIVTMTAIVPTQAAQTTMPTTYDRGTRIATPADATVVAFGAGTQRSGR